MNPNGGDGGTLFGNGGEGFTYTSASDPTRRLRERRNRR